jgi:hypothetical protein
MSLLPRERVGEMVGVLSGEVRKLGMVDTRDNCFRVLFSYLEHHLHLVTPPPPPL